MFLVFIYSTYYITAINCLVNISHDVDINIYGISTCCSVIYSCHVGITVANTVRVLCLIVLLPTVTYIVLCLGGKEQYISYHMIVRTI